MSIIDSLLHRLVPAPAAAKELSCSFCGKSRLVVRKLIAGPSVYICDECLRLSMQIIVEEKDGGGALELAASALDAAERLPHATRHADARPLLRGGIELSGQDPTFLAAIARAALRIDDTESALTALRRIPRAIAQPDDLLEEARVLIMLDRHGEALSHLHGLALGSFDPRQRALHRLHVLFAELHEVDELDGSEGDVEARAKSVLSALEIARVDVEALPESPQRGPLLTYCTHLAAHAHLLERQPSRALALADARLEADARLPSTILLRARALDALGRGAEADEARAEASALAHQDSHFRRRLSQRGAPFR